MVLINTDGTIVGMPKIKGAMSALYALLHWRPTSGPVPSTVRELDHKTNVSNVRKSRDSGFGFMT